MAAQSTSQTLVPLSVVVLTYNEEANLPDCLKSLTPWAGEIFVVDSFSQDRTVAIAESFGARVVQHRFEGHGAQRNWAMKTLPLKHEWVLALDADQRVLPELRDELAQLLASPPTDVDGFFVKRRQIFRKRWIKHGGYYPKYMLKLVRRGKAVCDEEELDDRFYVKGPTGKLKHDITEDNANEWAIGFWIQKHNEYAAKQAADELKLRRGERRYLTSPAFFGNPTQRVLWLKLRWYRLPLFVRPFLYFGYRYFLRLGILDGKQGFIFHFLQAFWFRLLVDIKMEEMMAADDRSSGGAVPSSSRQRAAV